MIIHNHPYLGASHTPGHRGRGADLLGGRALGFAAVTAHVLDVGGSFPGINADAFDVYAEAKLYDGLRWYRAGELNEDLDRMIFDNVRTETMNRGDMNAMMAACQLGRERFLRLFQRYGAEVVMSAAYDWMDYSEQMLREQIRKLPDGEYKAPTGWLDDDARNRGVRLRVETKVIVEGDEITIDLTGSSPEVPTGYNVPFEGSLLVGAYYAVRTILLDEVTFPEHVPQNDGVFRPVKVIAPKGTIYNPSFPRACFSRFCQVQRVVDNMILALADALPRASRPGTRRVSTSAPTRASPRTWASTGSTSRSTRALRRPSRQGRDGLCRQPDGEHAQHPDRGARPALPVPLRPVRTPPRAGAPGQWRGGIGIIRRNRFLVDGDILLRGRPPNRPAARHLRRLGRPRRLLPKEPRHRPGGTYPRRSPDSLRGRRIRRVPRAERRGLRRPPRPSGGGRARGRARRLHDDRARARRVRRRLRGRTHARARRRRRPRRSGPSSGKRGRDAR